MRNLQEVFSETNGLYGRIDRILKFSTYDEYDDLSGLDIDYGDIRLTELLAELLQMVDDKKLPFNPAVELSYLTKEEQGMLLGLMKELSAVPSLEQAKRLKKYSQEGKLGRDVMDVILTEDRPGSVKVTLKSERLKQYFPKSYTQEQMEEVIFSLLETWKRDREDKTE